MEQFFVKFIKLSLWKKYLLAVIAGGISALAFPGFYIVGVLWVCLPFVLLLQDSVNSKKESFFLGFFFGAGLFLFSMFWLYHPLTLMEGRFLWLVPFALIGIAIWGGVWIGLVLLGTSFFKDKFLKVLVFAFLWTVIEYFRSNFIFGGIAWNTVAIVWAKNIEFAQIASVIGSYNLTFITIFTASLPFGLNRKYLSASVIILLVLFAFGEYRLEKNPTEFTNKTFKIVQPNISQEAKHSRDNKGDILKTLLEMSKEGEKTDYVIWPETTFPYPWNSENNILNLEFDGNLITGVLRIQGTPNDFEVFNSVILLQNKRAEFIYDKMHLVPFGEYVPLAKILPIQKIVPGQKDFSSGKTREYLYIPEVGNIAISICYEIIFSGHLKGNMEKEADLMINITNDKWFGKTQAPYQHLASSVIRAIEEGIPVIRAANSGISAVIDPVGRIIKQTNIEEKTILIENFPIKTNTFFYKYENKITLLLLLIVLCIICFLNFKNKNS